MQERSHPGLSISIYPFCTRGGEIRKKKSKSEVYPGVSLLLKRKRKNTNSPFHSPSLPLDFYFLILQIRANSMCNFYSLRPNYAQPLSWHTLRNTPWVPSHFLQVYTFPPHIQWMNAAWEGGDRWREGDSPSRCLLPAELFHASAKFHSISHFDFCRQKRTKFRVKFKKTWWHKKRRALWPSFLGETHSSEYTLASLFFPFLPLPPVCDTLWWF